MSQRTEFRVVWTREGRRQSTRIYQGWSSACRKAQGILALEAVKAETRFETMPDLVEPPVIQQRTVGDWEQNPYYEPSEPSEGTKKEMLYIYGDGDAPTEPKEAADVPF